MEARILAHLGKADYTPRLFTYSLLPTPYSLSFNQVLDAIEVDYQAARAAGSREAPRLLATVAEAARLVGLHCRAERAYVAFQEAYPESAYGFRDLGDLYREQGRLEEAQRMLERAVEVSPRDTGSWLGLAEVYLERGGEGERGREGEGVEGALDTIYRQAPLSSRLYALRARLYQGQNDLARSADNLRKSLVIQESIPNRLALANLYRQLEQPQRAAGQCIKAADALLRTWPRPLDPQLWDIAVCLTQSDDDPQFAIRNSQFAIRNVLLGHVHRARGQLEQALTAYQAAASASPLVSGGTEGGLGGPHYFLGETYQALGQPELAEAEYCQAMQLDPLESLPLLALGRMQWSQEREEAALNSFRAAVEVTPGWGEAHTALGNALLASGDRDGAAEHYQLAQIADGDILEGVFYDFAAHLAEADTQSSGPDHVRNDYFTINGDRRRVLFAHPDSRTSYTVTVPEQRNLVFGKKPCFWLAFAIATAPESWEQVGDGVTFSVSILHPPSSILHSPFSTYIDPKQDEAARRWHPYAIDLSAYAGQTVTLIFETGTGPAGDERYDWAGWGEPRLVLSLSLVLSRRVEPVETLSK